MLKTVDFSGFFFLPGFIDVKLIYLKWKSLKH